MRAPLTKASKMKALTALLATPWDTSFRTSWKVSSSASRPGSCTTRLFCRSTRISKRSANTGSTTKVASLVAGGSCFRSPRRITLFCFVRALKYLSCICYNVGPNNKMCTDPNSSPNCAWGRRLCSMIDRVCSMPLKQFLSIILHSSRSNTSSAMRSAVLACAGFAKSSRDLYSLSKSNRLWRVVALTSVFSCTAISQPAKNIRLSAFPKLDVVLLPTPHS